MSREKRAKLITTQEAAEQLQISDETVRRWITIGHIKGVRPGLRQWLVPQAEIDRLLTIPMDDGQEEGSGLQSEGKLRPSQAAAT